MEHNTYHTITSIHLPLAIFQSDIFTPKRVNLIFGKNGTGKSTFAKAFRDTNNLSFSAGRSAADYEIFIFDREFVSQNIQQYGNLPGIVTVSVQNAEIQSKIQSLQQQRTNCHAELTLLQAESERIRQAADSLISDFQEYSWKRTKDERKKYEKALSGKKTKQKFADAILHAMPRYHETNQINVQYKKAFGEEAQLYPLFRNITNPNVLDSLAGITLLSEPVISSADSLFSRFMKKIQAVDWVQHGHAQFSGAANGVCPYCQQALPEDFDQQIAVCFDATYQQTLHALQQYYEQYRQTANTLFIPLQENLKNRYPYANYELYLTHMKLLKQQIKSNLEQIQQKIQNPSVTVTLGTTYAILEQINADILQINQAISENNQILTDKKGIQSECAKTLLEHFALMLQNDIMSYQSRFAQITLKQQVLTDQINTKQKEAEMIAHQLRMLYNQIADTRTAVVQINQLLEEAGFQSFSLRQSTYADHAYEVVRSDNQVAANLSEGEQCFLAFLYFYCLVRAESQSGRGKIVVIDDPFTALDAETAKIVMRLMRNLSDDCTAQTGRIQQLFVLTYHTRFFNELAQCCRNHIENISICTIQKHKNHSIITETVPK